MRIPLLMPLVFGLILMTGCVRVREVPSHATPSSGEAAVSAETKTSDTVVTPDDVVAPDEIATPDDVVAPEEIATPDNVVAPEKIATPDKATTPDEVAVPDETAAQQIEEIGLPAVVLIDFHIHIRGGMTVEKAVAAQVATGVLSGVLENAGVDWPLSDNEKIREFIDAAEPFPVLVGLQVNDRDWFQVIAPELLGRLDYILADTMIMNDENGKPQKLWQENEYSTDDVDAWLDRYFAHCMTVINEPVTIMANPTWLPPRVAENYDTFWNDERMTQLIDAAVKNKVAFEIQAGSAFPKDKFIELAKSKGAKFTIGRNNMDDKQPNFEPVIEKLNKHGLGIDEMLVIVPKKDGLQVLDE